MSKPTPDTGSGSSTDFERRTSALLRQSEAGIEPQRLQRLHEARRAAVAEADKHSDRTSAMGQWLWIPTGSVAALALVVGLFWGGVTPPPLPDPAGLSVAQDIELLEELEFVAWMLEQEANPEVQIHAG